MLNWILRILNLVPKEEAVAAIEAARASSAAAQRVAAQERARREEVERLLATSNTGKEAADRGLKLLEWTLSHLVDFYMGNSLPRPFIAQTLSTRRAFAPIGFMGKLHDADSFVGGANAAGLFWALTHASDDAYEAVRMLHDENTSTLRLVENLKVQMKTAHSLFGADLKVAVGQILSHRVPALKEVSVGADLLLLISGDGLVPGGGVRLAWIQFKLTRTQKSMMLNFHTERNERTGKAQFEALQGVHSLERGSFSLYALGSNGHPFYASIPIDWIEGVNMEDPSTCKVDLGEKGVRFQELMLMLAGNTGVGAFSTSSGGAGFSEAGSFGSAAEVLAYVDAAASERSIIPLMVLGVSSGRERVSSHQLVQQIEGMWNKRLSEYIRSRDQSGPDRPGPGRSGPDRGGFSR